MAGNPHHQPCGADPLAGTDPATWWDDSGHALREYVSPAADGAMTELVQAELGYRLPPSYIAMMRRHNGGIPRLTCFLSARSTTWAQDHVAVHGIFGIGNQLRYSLCGQAGSRFWINEWQYPPVGVYFADCPSAGHDMIALDYRDCGPEGEPHVVHVDQERGYAVTFLAQDYARFVRGLRPAGAFGST